jgi:hypothetical protein
VSTLLRTPPLNPKLIRAVWSQIGWSPHPLQEEVLLNPARQKVLSAGRRMGKSEVGGKYLIPEAFRALKELDVLKALGKRREYWIVGPEYSDAEKEFRHVWGGLEALGFDFDRPGSYNNPLSGEMRISMWDGRFIVQAKSAKYPGTLVGEGLSGVVFSEAAKLKLSVYHKYIRPTLADFQGWAFFGSTPEGRNWFYDFWNQGQDTNREGWASWRAPSWANPYVYPLGADQEALSWLVEDRRQGLPSHTADERRLKRLLIDEEVLSMFDDMSIEMFNQEVAALFTEFVGRVFKDFDEEIHVNDNDFRPDWETYACIDYGFTNPFVWLLIQMDPHGERVHIVDEYYEVNKSTEEAGKEIRSRGLDPQSIRMVYPDPAEPDRSRQLGGMLGLKFHGGGSIPLVDRLEWIRRGLKSRVTGDSLDSEFVPSLTVHRRCVNTIREMGAYRYRETAEQAADRNRQAPELPEKRDDHAPEALGRFYSGKFGSPHANARARQTKARVGRRR